jgi:hypothetical protein
VFFASVVAQAKIGDELFWEEKFVQPMGRHKHALKVPFIFSF